jgi:hypothetical protein
MPQRRRPNRRVTGEGDCSNPDAIFRRLRHASAATGVAFEVIALWLGHERPATTHGYVEADLKMKEESLQRLESVPASRRATRPGVSASSVPGSSLIM